MRALTVRPMAVVDSPPDHPCPAGPRLNSTHTDPGTHALKSSYLAAVRASGIFMTFVPGPGIGSGHGNAMAPDAQVVTNTGGDAENGADVMKSETVWALECADGLTGKDVRNLNTILQQAMADNTKANYLGQWLRFAEWARDRCVSALPANPAHVAAYLAERIERAGHRPATLRTAAAAIAFIHREAGLADPYAAAAVRRTLNGAARKAGRMQKQAAALTAEVLARIRATTYQPRPGRGGRPESRETAWRRGSVDMAIISLMRDAMLRVSEAAALTWADVVAEPDGSGRLLIRRSKTDPEGAGAVVYISTPTMALLAALRVGTAPDASVFGLRRNQMSKRIKQAARAAGLGEGFSGHSPRVGMARDLARMGIELPRLMTAGRWRSPDMPSLYIRNETAGKSAVAQFYATPPERAGTPRGKTLA